MKENIGVYRSYMSRFYKDLNGDAIPELFLSWYKGTGGRQFLIYQITKTSYLYLGNISIYSEEILAEQHHGFRDIITFWRLGKTASGETFGCLDRYEFNGEYYISKQTMDISEEHAIGANLFHSEQTNWEKHLSNDALQWSPKDDDPYRKIIK